ncbi:MAG: 50S ribosomal protein L10 [Polyangiaceae bacterium]|nr:50S ribosomal protein L10 [Polyangiaceae bacterium]
MNRTERSDSIQFLRERFDRMVSAVFVDFAGMTVEDVTKLREEFRKVGVEYRVVKNNLVHHAVEGRPYAGSIGTLLSGMTGIAWSFEEPGIAAKVVKAFVKDNPKLKIKGGVVESDVLTAASVENVLATMPGKDELRSTLLATFMAPMQGLVRQLNAPRQNFAYLLDARKRQLGGE